MKKNRYVKIFLIFDVFATVITLIYMLLVGAKQ